MLKCVLAADTTSHHAKEYMCFSYMSSLFLSLWPSHGISCVMCVHFVLLLCQLGLTAFQMAQHTDHIIKLLDDRAR